MRHERLSTVQNVFFSRLFFTDELLYPVHFNNDQAIFDLGFPTLHTKLEP